MLLDRMWRLESRQERARIVIHLQPVVVIGVSVVVVGAIAVVAAAVADDNMNWVPVDVDIQIVAWTTFDESKVPAFGVPHLVPGFDDEKT